MAGTPATRAAISRTRTRLASTRAAQHRLADVAERGVLGDGGLGRGGPRPTGRLEPQLRAELGDAGARAPRGPTPDAAGRRSGAAGAADPADRATCLPPQGEGTGRSRLALGLEPLGRHRTRGAGHPRVGHPAQPAPRGGVGRRRVERHALLGQAAGEGARETARPQGADALHPGSSPGQALALGPGPVGPAQPRHEARVPRVVQKPRGGSGAGPPHGRSSRTTVRVLSKSASRGTPPRTRKARSWQRMSVSSRSSQVSSTQAARLQPRVASSPERASPPRRITAQSACICRPASAGLHLPAGLGREANHRIGRRPLPQRRHEPLHRRVAARVAAQVAALAQFGEQHRGRDRVRRRGAQALEDVVPVGIELGGPRRSPGGAHRLLVARGPAAPCCARRPSRARSPSHPSRARPRPGPPSPAPLRSSGPLHHEGPP